MLGNCGLFELVEVRHISNAAVAGTTTITPTSIDMSGYDAIAVIADLGTLTDGAQPVLTMKQGSQSGGGDAANATDPAGNTIATPAFTAASQANGVLMAELIRPSKRYVTPVLTRATQNVVVNCMIALLYRAKKAPVTQGSTVFGAVTGPAA